MAHSRQSSDSGASGIGSGLVIPNAEEDVNNFWKRVGAKEVWKTETQLENLQ